MYALAFRANALKQWNSLDPGLRRELLPILERRLLNPFVPSARLRGDLAGCYKIKLRKSVIRVVYFADGEKLVVTIIAVGKRDGETAYRDAAKELKS